MRGVPSRRDTLRWTLGVLRGDGFHRGPSLPESALFLANARALAACLGAQDLFDVRLSMAAGPWPHGELWRLCDEGASRSRMQTALLHACGDEVLGDLRGEGLAVMPIKGFHLGKSLYADVALRPLGDVDLLVREGDYGRAQLLLERRGFQRLDPGRSAFRGKFLNPANGVIIDLHSRLLARWGGGSCCFERSIDGVLTVEDSLVYSIRHGAIQHRLENIAWVNDVYFLLIRGGATLHWDRVMEGLKGGAEAAALLMFALVSDGEGVVLPPAVMAELALRAGVARAWVARRLASMEFLYGGALRSWGGVAVLRATLRPMLLGSRRAAAPVPVKMAPAPAPKR